MKELELFEKIGNQLNEVKLSKMFGKPCLKINKKAFACFHDNAMVFKLEGATHNIALAYDGAKLFDPSNKGRPMKEWVQVPYSNSKKWESLANEAKNYVESLQ